MFVRDETVIILSFKINFSGFIAKKRSIEVVINKIKQSAMTKPL